MNGRNLDAIQNTRIHRLMSKLLGYRFKVLWTPGKTQCIADALSRSPVFKADEEPDILVCTVLVNRAGTDDQANHTADPALEKLIKHATEDPDYQKVWAAVRECRELNLLPSNHPAQAYKSYWDAMAVELELPNLVLYHGRIIVPKKARKEVLETAPYTTYR